MSQSTYDAVTVTLNPAIDRTVTISNFTAGEVNRAEQVRNCAGGKGVNVACALADDGRRVGVTGFLGRDNSAIFERLFAQKGIADDFVRLAGQTRVGIKITDPVLKQTTDINFPGLEPSSADIDALREQMGRCQGEWFVLAGSLPPGMDAGIYRELTAQLKARGAKVALDAGGEPLRLALDAAPDIIKPNLRELEATVGESLPTREAVERAARGLLSRGVGMVVISMGADGALFVTAETTLFARPPSVEVRSTVGAGDAMVAGIVAARLRGLRLADCARLATAFSLDALTRIEPGLTSVVAVESAMGSVTIE
jgi:1-phosphofructokinase